MAGDTVLPDTALLNTAGLEQWIPIDHWDTGAFPADPAGTTIEAKLQATWLQVLLCVAAALPVLWPHMPPLTDLGGHLGRFAVQLDGGASASLRQWYSFHWSLIPNLGVDLLMQTLAPLLGLEPALKAIVVGIVLLQAGGFLMLAKVVHGRLPPTTLLALPLVYGYPFQYGFLNFTLCAALGTWALALWIVLGRVADHPDARPGSALLRWLVFVPVACTLWVCHLEGWALFCTLAAGVELGRWRAPGSSWRDACLRAAPALSCLLAPCLLVSLISLGPTFMAGPASNPYQESAGWFDVVGKLGMVVMAMRDRWGVWDVASALLLVGMVAWTWRSRWFTGDAGLALAAMLAGAAFVLVPKHIGGTSFVDMRLVPMALAMALIAVRPRNDCPPHIVAALAVAGLVFVGARFAGNAISMALLDRQISQDLTVLNTVPRDTLLVSLSLKPCLQNDPWIRERRTHLAGYALARRHDFANDQWAMAGGQLLRVHNPAVGYFTGDPSQTGYPTACRGMPSAYQMVAQIPQAVQYLWIIENGIARTFPDWHPIRTSSGSVLYARDEPKPPLHRHHFRKWRFRTA